MRSKLLPLFLVVISTLSTSGQDNLDKIIHVWGNMLWNLSPITVDHSGNIYLSGEFADTIFFGSKENWLVNVDSLDFFITKIYPDGSLAWTKVISGMGAEHIFDIEVDMEGFVYLTGAFDYTMMIDTLFIDNGGPYDYFLCKLDPEGKLVDLRRGSENGEDLIFEAIEIDGNGKICLIGWAQGDSVFDFQFESLTQNLGGYSGFMIKLDSSFDVEWITSICDSADIQYTAGSFYTAIIPDQLNNIYASGYANTSEGHRIFISKVDKDGSLLWMNTVAGPEIGTFYLPDVFVDKHDDVYWIANIPYDNHISFPDTVYGNAFIAKYNKEGEYIWSTGLESYLWTFVVDRNGYTFATYGENWDALYGLLIVDPQGDIVYDHPFDSIEFRFLALDPAGNVYYNGLFQDEITIAGQIVYPKKGENYIFGNLKVEEMISSLNTEYIKQDDTHHLYPNPTTGTLNFVLDERERIISIEIYDLSGRLVHSDTQVERMIDVRSLKDGVYIIRFRTNKSLIIEKIIIY